MVATSGFPCDRSMMLTGPAGQLEAAIACPRAREPIGTAVILHPHPLHGGTMQNKVVTTVARAFVDCSFASVRFNFRGIGRSEGEFADSRGEAEDALAVIEWIRQRRPGEPVWLAGFSFGAYVALRIAADASVAGLVTVAPAIHLYDFSGVHLPVCPWLLIQGEDDEVVPVTEVRRWVEGLRQPPEAVYLPSVGHFFHQRLDVLRSAIAGFVPAHT